jgi:phospholipid/cholesterol/gamma-HCH transport system substrate-binding protein
VFDRKKQLNWFKLRVGIVITLALLLLFLTVFFSGSIEKLFTKRSVVQAQIRNVNGLRIGAPVWFSGVEVGTVTEIALEPKCGTLVSLAINKDVMNLIRKDCVASVLTIGLLGDKYIDLSSGTAEAAPLQPGDQIQGATQLDMKDMMEIATKSIKKMNDFIGKLEILVTDIETGGGTFSRLIKDPALYDRMTEVVGSISVAMNDINQQKGSLGMLIKDPTLYKKLTDSSSRMNEILQKIDSTASSVDSFAAKLASNNGTLQRLIEDPQLYENLAKGSHQLTLLLEGVDKGEGAAGALLRDEELAGELRSTITDLKLLLEDVKANPRKYFKFSVF